MAQEGGFRRRADGEPGSGGKKRAGAVVAAVAAAWLAAAAWSYFAGPPLRTAAVHPSLYRQQGDGAHFNNYFRREERSDAYILHFGFSDFRKKGHRLSFEISRAHLGESEQEYGYVLEEINAYLDAALLDLRADTVAELEVLARQSIRKSEFSRHITIERSGPGAQSFKLKVAAPPELRDQVKAEFDRIMKRVAAEQKKRLAAIDKRYEKLRRAYLENHGLRFHGDRLGVDYGFIVRRNQPRVRNVIKALRAGADGLKLHEFMAHVLAFVQEIRYGLPPLEENGRYIFEFWPPPKVLVNNLGDCDSKGVAFASFWSLHSRYPLLLIKIPNHMLAAVALPAVSRQGLVINGLRYTLMEVTGPGKYPPGLLFPSSRVYLESGRYLYERIR